MSGKLTLKELIDKAVDFCKSAGGIKSRSHGLKQLQYRGKSISDQLFAGWLVNNKLPEEVFADLVRAFRLEQFCREKHPWLLNEQGQLEWERFCQELGVTEPDARKNRAVILPTASIKQIFDGQYATGSSTLSLSRMTEIIQNIKSDSFIVVMNGSIEKPIVLANDEIMEATCQAIARGVRLVVICPSPKKYHRWKDRGFEVLMPPEAYEQQFEKIAERVIEIQKQQPGAKLEQVIAAVQSSMIMLQSDECEHIRLSVEFIAIGDLLRTGIEQVTIRCGVRYAEATGGGREEVNTTMRILKPNSWSEERVLYSISFLLRDSLIVMFGRHALAEELNESDTIIDVFKKPSREVLGAVTKSLYRYFAQNELNNPFDKGVTRPKIIAPLQQDKEKRGA